MPARMICTLVCWRRDQKNAPIHVQPQIHLIHRNVITLIGPLGLLVENHFTFLKYLNDVSTYIVFVPFFVMLVNYESVKTTLMPLFVLFIIALIVEILNDICFRLGRTNLPLLNLYTVIEFTAISLFYRNFFKLYFKTNFFLLPIGLFVLLGYFDFYLNGVNSYGNILTTVESVVFTFYSLFLFYYILKHLLFDDLLSSGIFWINSAIIIYFAGNLILFVFSDYIMFNLPKENFFLWSSIHSVINIFFNILIAIGFWKTRVR